VYVMLHRTKSSREGRCVADRIEHVIGVRMYERREELGLTQEQVGEGLGGLLDKPWSRQAVSAAEKGNRAFTAAELVAIAWTLRTTVSWLLTPLLGESGVRMPSGTLLGADQVVATVLPREQGEWNGLDEMRQTIVQMGQKLRRDTSSLDRLMADIRVLYRELMQRNDLPLRMDRIGREVDTTGMDARTLARDTFIDRDEEEEGPR
jgi:transcriptional regulator with XRE-family HTH domain